MTPDLEGWLQQATRSLSKDSAAQVRAEIQEHYQSAREAAISGGASQDEASRVALAALGDAKTANKQYLRVLLTESEARLLREGNREAWVVCSTPWLQRLLLGVSLIALLAAGTMLRTGWTAPGRIALALGLGIGLTILAPRLPVYTPSRARVFRFIRWTVQVGLLLVAFGPGAIRMSWLVLLCVWQLVWVESKRASIRRKLPVADWPRQLYL
ncbi:MAG TPA: hypothetical protein VIY49_29650 [Bryobacteraceae bacterium]